MRASVNSFQMGKYHALGDDHVVKCQWHILTRRGHSKSRPSISNVASLPQKRQPSKDFENSNRLTDLSESVLDFQNGFRISLNEILDPLALS